MKKIAIAFCLLSICQFGFSQRFINGVGVSVFSTGGNEINSFVTGGITYSPRVNISESDNSAISIGLPISLGLSYSSNTSTGSSSASILVNMPLIVNYNYGCGSTRDNESRFGFFAGGGFGYHLAGSSSTDSYGYGDGFTKVNAVGPVANAGIRFGVGQKSHNIEIKLSYMKGLDVTKANIIGAAGIFNF